MNQHKLNDQLQRIQIRDDINKVPRPKSPRNDKRKEAMVKQAMSNNNDNGVGNTNPPSSPKVDSTLENKDLLHIDDIVKSRWRVVKKIGSGGFGEIYEAVDTQPGKTDRSATDTPGICSLCAANRVKFANGANLAVDIRLHAPSISSPNRSYATEKSRQCKDCGREYYPSLQRYPSEDCLESIDSGIGSGQLDRQELANRVAIKTESNTQPKQMLRMEVAVLRRLQGRKDFCELFACGKNTRINYIIMTLQGENLSEIRKRSPSTTFSVSTSLRLVNRCLTALEALHQAGFLHRDVKPSNFAIRRDDPSGICILDFGLVRQYTVPGSANVPRPPRAQAGFRGTVRYASANAHLSRELGRHDDIWSLYYMLVEFLCGRLPWRRLRDKELVGKVKMKTDSVRLGTDAGLPIDIAESWIGHLCNLSYFATPDYSELRAVISKWLEKHQVCLSDPYDWQTNTPTNKVNQVEQMPFSPKFKQQYTRQSKRSSQELNYLRRSLDKKAFGSAANLASGDSNYQDGLARSTLAIAEDALTNQHRTQVPGCITMASENNLHADDDDEASHKMDQREMLMASRDDLKKVGTKNPTPVKKQNAYPSAIRKKMSKP